MKKSIIGIFASVISVVLILVVVFVVMGKSNSSEHGKTHGRKTEETIHTTTRENTTTQTKITAYSITYELDGGRNNRNNPTSFTNDSDIVLKDASKDGYEFKGWYLDSDYKTKVETINSTFSEDIKLYAKFEKIVAPYDYTITYNLDGGTNNPNNPSGFYNGDSFDLLDPTKDGYDFKGWFTSTSYSNRVDKIEFDFDYELYALFEVHKYNITYINVDGINNTNPDYYTKFSDNITLNDVEKADYNFYGWYTTSTFDSESKITTIDTSKLEEYTLYAKFVEKETPNVIVTSNNRVYDGNIETLVNSEVENGTLYYSLDNVTFTTTIPTGRLAKTYTIYYKVVGDSGYKDIDVASITTTISPAELTNVLVTGYSDYEDGNSHNIVKSKTATAVDGEISWLFSKNQEDWFSEINVSLASESGTYYYKVSAENHNTATGEFIVTITPKNDATLEITNLDSLTKIYDGTSTTPDIDTNSNGIVTINYYQGDDKLENAPINVGTYTIEVIISSTKEYNGNSITENFAISKKELTLTGISVENKTYDGTNSATISSYGTLIGIIDGDIVTLDTTNITATFASVNAGNDILVNVEGIAITGESIDNYYISQEATVYANINKANSTVTAPTAKDLTYTGETQALINEGSATGGTIKYSLDGINYSTDVPTGKNANNYTVYYMVEGNENYNGIDADSIDVVIKAAELTNVKVIGYNGHEKVEGINAVISKSANTVDETTVSWLFSDDNKETWKNEIIVSKESDSKTYYYKVSAANHIDVEGSFEVIITKKTPTTIEEINLSKTYDGTAIVDPTIITNSDGVKTITYYEGDTKLDSNPINVGTYTIVVTIAEAEDFGPGNYSTEFTISKKELTLTGISVSNKTYDGTNSATISSYGSLVGIVDGDIVTLDTTNIIATFASVNAGNDILVNVEGIAITGDSIDNYYINSEATVYANIDKANSTVTAPTAKTLTYTGEAQALINEGSATGGTIVYSLNGTDYSAEIPTGLNAVNYKVYYKVIGNDNYNGIDADSIDVIIKKADSTVTAPTAKDLTYTGEAQALINEGSATGGTIQYSLNGTDYSAIIPTGLNAVNYKVYYKVIGNDNYNGIDAASIDVIIKKADSTVTAPTAKDLTYTGEDQALINEGSATGGTIQYSLNGTDYSAIIPTGLNAGNYTVYYKVIGNDNYNGIDAESIVVKVAKKNPTYTTPTGLEADFGETLADVALPEGFSFQDDLSTLVGPAGVNYFYVTYTPTDTTNYKEITDIKVEITVIANAQMVIECSALEATYSGSAQGPAITITVSGIAITSGYNLTTSYKLKGASDYTIGLPTNAGTYDIKINCTSDDYIDADEVVVTFTINKKTLTITNSTIGVDYSSSVRTWAQVQAAILNNITANNIVSGIAEGDSVTINVNGIHDGKYKYGTVSGSYIAPTSDTLFGSSYGNVIGSTYLVTLGLDSNNYTLPSNYQIILKYKTALVGSTYYTVEDALSTSGTSAITFAGDATDAQTYVATVFSSLDTAITNYKTTYTISKTLIVPYTSGTSTSYGEHGDTKVDSSNTYSALVINENITLNVTTLCVNAEISGSSCVGTHGTLVNNGTINCSGTVYAYGYIKGLGEVNVLSGAKCHEALRIYDYPGSADTAYDVSKVVFPMYEWSLNSVSCNLKIMKGAYLYGLVVVWGTTIKYQPFSVSIINNSSSGTDYLFAPASNATSNDYVKIYCSNSLNSCNTNIVSNNQEHHKNITSIELNGSYIDGKLNIEKSILVIITIKFATSASIPLPISYANIILKSGSYLKISNTSYVFLNGTKLEVEKDATLEISGDAFIALDQYENGKNVLATGVSTADLFSKTSSYMMLNGTLKGTGKFGGIIKTTSANAKIQLQYNFIPKKVIVTKKSASPYTVFNENNYYIKLIQYNVETSQFNDNYSNALSYKYSSSQIGSKYGWVETESVISYETGCDLVVDNITITMPSSGYKLTSDMLPQLERNHYIFGGWYIDSSFTKQADDRTIFSSIILYAKWTLINYNISYIDIYDNDFASGNTSASTNQTTFNYETDIALSTPTNGEYVFGGFYLDSSATNRINILQGSSLVSMLNSDSINIYQLWYNVGTNKYVVSFINSNTNIQCPTTDTVIELESYSLPAMDSKDNDYNVPLYFGGWYNNDTLVSSLTSEIFTYNSTTGNYEVTLTAKWIEKNTLSINVNQLGTIMEVYYKPGFKFTIPSLESKGITLGDSGAVLINWQLNDGNSYNTGQKIELTTQTELNANIALFVQLSIGANAYTTVTVTLTKNKGYIVTYNQSTGVSSATAFNGETKTNGDMIYVTIGSEFQAKYTKNSNSTNNSASVSGAGSITSLTTSNQTLTVTDDVSIAPAGEEDSNCVVEGTLITMADGTKKAVEDIVQGDLLLVFNHETGEYDVSFVLFNDSEDLSNYVVINLEFSNGSIVKVVSEHGFFDLDLMKYVYITEENYLDYVGHRFYAYGGEIVTLDNAYITIEETRVYSPVTAFHLNYFTEDLLSMPGGIVGLFNIFEYDESLKYDEEKKNNDIETYGLFTYADFEDIIPEEIYEVFNGAYLKIAIAKGLVTFERIAYYAERYGIYW